MSTARTIFRTSYTSGSEIQELLQALLLAELVVPSEELWIVSPWVSDLRILDNRTGAFSAIGAQWGPRRVWLSEVLLELLESTRVFVVTRPDRHNESLVQRITDLAAAAGREANLVVLWRDALHLKGILGRDFYLSGSMNLTFNGVEILDEGVRLETDDGAVANARIAFHQNYGDRV